MKPSLTHCISGIFMLIVFSSCVSRQEIVYYQNDLDNVNFDLNKNLKIQPNDQLTIRVSTPEQEAAIPFNLTKSVTSQANMGANVELETYMVAADGTIEFPVLGTIEVEGLNTFELSKKIKDAISIYVKDAIVNVRVLNFKISVLGEVQNPGTFIIQDDYISLTQALGMAGDMTIFGRRDNVMVVRENDGSKTKAYLDLTDFKTVDSPYFNLRQNDVVYVEPIGTRRQSAGVINNASGYIAILSFLISTVILVTN
ncbi:polysaccharide biosynthesis/export family protein [Gramella sp. GC03-9]|uniref:Polysaccharide biosynthesis/export family protein n=1 Tax=Christiangramia oceanisediminis TaxID=2920386 RepID=A0A9X2I234_9FLAO|nr:polysaccharide biosynthesis/export family protein [Gramella oceanisediminis]MCP9199586.1 polysaccharide biosynthesis/export family protein [Gramella oceanisediminis]